MNNREIKFRVWDKKENRIYTTDNQCYDHEYGSLAFYIEEELGDRQYWIQNEEIEIMQFSGLQDKNGKDIYEGDIVFFEGRNYEVFFDTERGGWNCRDGGFYKQNLTKIRGLRFEVIGNIYENKELIT